MALPIGYSWRNLVVRRTSTLFTALGIGLTVAVFCGVFALRNGFQQLYAPRGSEDVAIYLRPGANSEGESLIAREQANIILKERPEIARNDAGDPIAAAESYLAVYMDKIGGGQTNVPLRGVQPMTFEVLPRRPDIVDGRMLQWGADEIIVGMPLTERIVGCQLGETLMLNLTAFKVVGVFDAPGAYRGEVWGDVERMMTALERPAFQRVIARLNPEGAARLQTALEVQKERDLESKALAKKRAKEPSGSSPGPAEASGEEVPRRGPQTLKDELEDDPRTPLQILSEREYLAKQTSFLSAGLLVLAVALTVIMGFAAVLGAMNTMLSSVSARTHEVGVLKAIGYRPGSIWLAFVIESAFVGLVGGGLGLLIVAPFHGVQTGATNWNTFTDVSFSFRLSPEIAVGAFVIAFLLGIVGGAIPAWRASRLRPVDALRGG